MLEVGFFGEEGVRQGVLPLVALVGVHTERARGERTAEGADALDACLLVDDRLAVGGEVFDHRGTLPVVVPVADAEGPVAGTTIDTLDEDADGVAVEVLLGAGDGEDGEVDVGVGLDERTRDDGAGEISVAKEGKAVGAGDVGRELARERDVAIGARGRTAIEGVDEGAAFGNGDLQLLGARGEDARGGIDDGLVETVVGEWAAGVGAAGSGGCAIAIGVAAIGGGCPRATGDSGGVDERETVATVGVIEVERVAVAVELHVDVVRGPHGVVVVEPEHGIAVGGDRGRVVDARLAGCGGFVAEVATGDVDVGGCGVVELYPAAVVERRVEPLVDVRAAQLVDDQGSGLGERGECEEEERVQKFEGFEGLEGRPSKSPL